MKTYSKKFIDSFVHAYNRNVACASDEAVRAFLQDYAADMDCDQLRDKHMYSSNIEDALCMFEAGMVFKDDPKIKTSELTGAALDWAVTKCEGHDASVGEGEWGMWGWASSWGQASAIIERENISITSTTFSWWECAEGWYAHIGERYAHGDTPLIAAMRCYVASVMGDEIYVPEELKEAE